MSIALAVLAIELMAALHPAFAISITNVAGWMALAFGLNIGLQMLSFVTMRKVLAKRERVPVSIVAGMG